MDVKRALSTGIAGALLAMSSPAAADVITNGSLSMGLFDDGGLGDNGVGLSYGPVGDAITPGCLCEGWGAAANGTGTYTYGGSSSGFSSAVLSDVTASSAKSTVVTSNGLTITHTYSPVSGSALFQVDVAIRNTSGAALSDVRYARTLDWDVPPGHFSDDFTTIYGGTPSGPGGKVLHTSLDPFAAPNPMITRSSFANQNRTNEPGDLGGYFIFSFGVLGIDETIDFTTFIGAADSVSALLSDFSTLDVEAYSYTFDDDGPTAFGYGFVGLGLPPIDPPGEVPEPGMLGLFGLGVIGMGLARRRRRIASARV